MSASIRARLDAMQARADAATEGPWELRGGAEYVAPVGILVAPDDGGVSVADAEFIAAARQDLPALLAFARDALGLHTPVTHGPANGWVGAPFTECRECRRSWPCPTVAATRHLGGGSDD